MKLLLENWKNYLEEEEILVEKCWPGYQKKGMKKMFGKMYPNCVKKKKSKKSKKNEAKKTRVKTNVDSAVDDLFNDFDLDDTSLTVASPEDKEPAGPTQDDSDPVRGKGGSFEDFSGQDLDSFLDDMLGGPAPEGNFEDEFSAAAARAQKNKARFQSSPTFDDELDPYDDIEDFDGTPTPTTKRFQTSQPSYAGEPGLSQKSSRDPSRAIERVMMDEFVTPAMAVGQTVLPTVWSKIKRLARKPGFEDAFHIALNGVRTDEDMFFQNLLKVDLGANQMPPPAESRELVEQLRTVLSRYYNLVLDEAGKNSDNLLRKLQSIRNRHTDEAFRTGFKKAIQKSRDLEDEAFGQFLGSTVGRKLS
jgi:hypothetical protein